VNFSTSRKLQLSQLMATIAKDTDNEAVQKRSEMQITHRPMAPAAVKKLVIQ
jgi:hypothetical protein